MPAAPSSRGAALTCRSWLIGCVILLLAVTAQGIRYENQFETGTDPRFYFEFILGHEPGSIDPLVDRCRDVYNGTLVAADTEEMYEAIKVAVRAFDDYLTEYDGVTVVLGGSFTDGDCPSGGTTYCPFCWDNGQRNCAIGANNQFALAKKDNEGAYIHMNGPNGWKSLKAVADPKQPYVCYSTKSDGWTSCQIQTDDIMMCAKTTKWTAPWEESTTTTTTTLEPGRGTGDATVGKVGDDGHSYLWLLLLIVPAVVAIAWTLCWYLFRRWRRVVDYKMSDDESIGRRGSQLSHPYLSDDDREMYPML